MSINPDARSPVKNMCSWPVSFTLPNSNASILLAANEKKQINNGELMSLADNQNVMFAGTGEGNHARVYIENEAIRKYAGYDSEDGKKKQFILTDDECQKILDYKTISTFKKHLETDIVANHEKARIIQYARKVKLNDFDKIVLLEEHTGIKFKQ